MWFLDVVVELVECCGWIVEVEVFDVEFFWDDVIGVILCVGDWFFWVELWV